MARLFARIAALVLGISAFAAANAQTYTYTFYVGNTNSPGCAISTPAGTVEHVKWRLQATVTAGTAPQFGSVTRADCSNDIFGSPSAVTSTSAVGLNTGSGGADVIEVKLPIGAVGPTPSPREVLAVVASSTSGSDALIATAFAKGLQGPASTPAVIPSLGTIAVALLGLALLAVGWFVLRRSAHVLLVSMLLIAGTAWAVSIVIDGQVGDWATVSPSSDPAGDVGESGIDLVALYVTSEGSNGYLRVDVADLQNPPVANAGSASLLEDGSTTITLTGSDPGGAPLTFQITSAPTRGSLGVITPIDATSASVLYTANADEFGTDSFSFTVDNGSQTSTPASVAITIDPVNDAPSFTAVDPPTVNEGSGAHSVPGWASFDPGPANESGQVVLEYLVSGIGNPALFSVAPAVDASGTLTYTLAAQANGSSSFTVAVRDDGGTANGGIDLGAAQSFTVSVDAVNGAPTFVGGGNASALEDAGAQSITGWATAIDDGDPELSQGLSFSLSANSNPSLFASGPVVDPLTGNLSYTPAADANGTADLTLVLNDDGGVANGGSDTSAPHGFTIQITPVNDAPSFTAIDPLAVNENSGAQSVPSWAAFDPGPADESAQAVSEYAMGAIGNPSLFAVAPSVAVDGTLSYTVAPNVSGSSTFAVAVRDDGGVANGGVDLGASQVFTITVNSVNSAPSFTGGGDVASDEDAGAQNFAAWATAITDGDPEVQTLTFNVTGNTNPALFSAAPAVDAVSGNLSYTAAANASGSATITLTLSDDGGTANGGSDTSAPYNFTITVNAVNDAPTATAKSHSTHSAIELEIVAASHTGELLEGAADPDDPVGDLTAVVVAGSATPAGAQVTVTNASDGSFRYDPPGGYSGAGSFQFRICDDGVPAAPQQCSAATTVTFVITGPDLYFVDDNAATGGDGGLNDPFDALADLPAGRGNNDRIFVFAGNYPTAVHSFLVGEHLVGQGTTGAFDTVLGVTVPGNGALDARPALTGVTGDRPALNRIVMAGAAGATMRGVALSTASSESVFINGTTGVTVTESSATSSISGVNINASSASAEGVTFSSVSSTGGVNGIVLNNLSGPGSFNFGAGSLTGNTGVSFLATGTLATTSYGGSISKTSAGNLVELNGVVAATDTGSVTLSGALSCTGNCTGIDVINRDAGTITFSGTTKTLSTGANAAVTLDNNDAATISFTGGTLDIDTTSGAGFNALNGANSITVTGANNTIDSTTGTALSVVASAIGSSGLTFRSISANGGANGIVLDGTCGGVACGSAAGIGGLNVTGDGANTTLGGNGTGGTLSNMAGADGATAGIAIRLNNTRDVMLRRINVTGVNQNYGIRGYDVHNLTLEYCTVGAPNPASAADVATNLQGTAASLAAPENAGEGSVYFGNSATGQIGLTGAGTITNCEISAGRADNMRVVNSGGTLNRLTITGTTFGLNHSVSGNSALTIEGRRPASGNTVLNSTVTGNIFTGSPGNAANFTGQEPDVGLGVSMDSIFQNNTVTNNHANNVLGGSNLTIAGFSNNTFDSSGNSFRDANGSAIVLQMGAPGLGSAVATSLVGRVENNPIGVTGVANSGSASGNGIFFSFADNVTAPDGVVTLAVNNNQIRGYNGNAAIFADNTGGSYGLNLTMQGNLGAEPGAGAFAGLAIAAGAPASMDDIDICASIGGAGAQRNDFSTADPGNSNDVIVGVSTAASSMLLPGYGGASLTDVENFVFGNNNFVGTVVSVYADAPATPASFTGGAACPTPP